MTGLLEAVPLWDVAACRELDRWTMTDFGIPGPVLMEQAGAAIACRLAALRSGGEPLTILAGPGNNGGDGYVVARRLAERGWMPLRVLALQAPESLQGDAAWAAGLWLRSGGTVECLPDSSEAIGTAMAATGEAGLWLDALFGTGLTRAPEGRGAAAIVALNRLRAARGARVLAVDMPSGVLADDGRVPGAAVTADWTLTMGLDKPGLRIWPGAGHAGQVEVVDLGYPASQLPDLSPAGFLLTGWQPAPLTPDRHKGHGGQLAVLGGSAEMPGAPALTARAALRAGAGRVTVWTVPGGESVLPPEIMRRVLPDWEALDSADLEAQDAWVLGPGLGRSAPAMALVGRLLALPGKAPLVIDADALFALTPERLAAVQRPLVITPHPGEAARMLGRRSADINAARLAAVRELAPGGNIVAVLKGAGTLIASAGHWQVSPWALPQLAVPGSGDVLAGVLGALLAQGLVPVDAAATAVLWHAEAAVGASPKGLLAGELADRLPRVAAARGDRAAS